MENTLSSSAFTAESGRTQFLEMFVAQVQHQDPLSPMDQTQILGQLAQFSQVEGIESLNKNFASFLEREVGSTTELIDTSAAMLGRNVEYGDDGSGVVDAVRRQDGQVLIEVNGQLMPVADVNGIS